MMRADADPRVTVHDDEYNKDTNRKNAYDFEFDAKYFCLLHNCGAGRFIGRTAGTRSDATTSRDERSTAARDDRRHG